MLRTSITEEEINEMPVLTFTGNIHQIRSDVDVQRAYDFLKNFKELGFDTESKPSFKKGQKNHVSIIQLSTRDDAFVFQLKYIHEIDKILKILSDPEILKIGVAISNDMHELRRVQSFQDKNFVDLQKYVKNFNIESLSLKKIAAIVLEGKISKRQQRSNWSLDNLSEAQLKYAATDAWACLLIYEKLKEIEEHN